MTDPRRKALWEALTQRALMLERTADQRQAARRLRRLQDAEAQLDKAASLLTRGGRTAEPELMAEIEGIRGRVYKRRWLEDPMSAKGREYLRRAFEIYEAMFRQDPTSFYNGDNAAALCSIYKHLTGAEPTLSPKDADSARKPELARKHADLIPATRFAALNHLRGNPTDFWARTTLANLAVMESPEKDEQEEENHRRALNEGREHCRAALKNCTPDKFMVNAVAQQLRLFESLGFRTKACEDILAILNKWMDENP
jgi:hypothetical protein